MTPRPRFFPVVVTALLIGTSMFASTPAGATSATSAASAQAEPTVQTTSTLPTDNRDLGNSLPKPNSGATPTSSGDPGGSRQAVLFWLVLVAIAGIVVLVWRSSARARRRREEAGLDPVSRARAAGVGLRAEAQTRSSTLNEPVEPTSTKRPD